MGDSKNPMYFIAIACFANIVFDYVFIGACKMGPAGAYLMSTLFSTTLLPMGLATAAGSLFSVVICVIAFMILRKKMYKNMKNSK